jgi:DNA-binding CsgD family transcriptional regulator
MVTESAQVAQSRRKGAHRSLAPGELRVDFTPAECAVYALMGEGLASAEIAGRLCVTAKTVEAHIAHMCAKRGGVSTRQLRYEAIETDVLRRYGLIGDRA